MLLITIIGVLIVIWDFGNKLSLSKEYTIRALLIFIAEAMALIQLFQENYPLNILIINL